MKRLLLALIAAAALAAPAAAAPPIRIAILHVVSGCHVWSLGQKPAAALTVKAGARVELRPNCPMDFDLTQTAGPKVALTARLHAGSTATIVFRKRGLYRFTAKNVQTPEEQGLQTLGEPHTLTLAVRVK